MPAYIPPHGRSKPFRNSNSNQKYTRDQSKNDSALEQTSLAISNDDIKKRRDRFRLPPPQDPLEAAGLPSKGDTILLDLKAQESYYTLLQSRYMAWYRATRGEARLPSQTRHTSGDPDSSTMDLDLSQSFEGMSLDGTWSSELNAVKQSTSAESVLPAINPAKELAILHMSMRKLREAILSTARTDFTAQQIYIFIIRASVLTRTFESYHPALLHLLHGMHSREPLSLSTLHEFIGYHILDTACRLGDYGQALALRNKWRFRDRNVDGLLTALIRHDWVTFWKIRDALDGYQRALMGWAEDRMRKHALKCVGKAYISVSKGYVERVAGGREWKDIVEKDGVGWEEDGEMVVIRRKPVGGKTGT